MKSWKWGKSQVRKTEAWLTHNHHFQSFWALKSMSFFLLLKDKRQPILLWNTAFTLLSISLYIIAHLSFSLVNTDFGFFHDGWHLLIVLFFPFYSTWFPFVLVFFLTHRNRVSDFEHIKIWYDDNWMPFSVRLDNIYVHHIHRF